MIKKVPITLAAMLIAGLNIAQEQRYLQEVFTNAQIDVTPNITYGTNIDFLTSNFASPNVPANVQELQTAVQTGQPIPAAYFNPQDASTAVKVTNVQFDLYQPDQGVDTETARPLVIYLHTGNALPPPLNGSPNGRRQDSTAVEMCRRMARRGYVAASTSYRLGWNPLAPTEEERRGQLLNAIYRAIHDVRQQVRYQKAQHADGNPYRIDPNKIIVIGEGTGGYIAVANATLDDPAKFFIEKFRPDPFNPDVSYIDTLQVGNVQGFGGALTLYRPNGFDHETHFCMNMGGALADISWLEQGHVPMVAFHTVFDPFAPFTEGIVIVPTTGGPVVDVHGSNVFIDVANDYGNNDSFATLPNGDPFTDRARSLYGTTVNGVQIRAGNEGLFPFIRPNWPAPAGDEASPWQFWDPNHPLATAEVAPGITAHMPSMASNPDMSPTKARAYIDTIMGYLNPRVVCALELGPCVGVGINENSIDHQIDVYPNPASDRITIGSSNAIIRRYVMFDQQGRQVQQGMGGDQQIVLERKGLQAGSYFVEIHFDEGTVVRKLILD
jgi:hypothetical protein